MSNTYEIKNSYSITKLDLVREISSSASLGLTDTPLLKTTNNKISLLASFDEISIFHDIDQIAASGYIVITEQGNLIKTFPIIGWERLDIEFSIKDSSGKENIYIPYKHSYFIYAIDTLSEVRDSKRYILRFADLAALINVSSRLEKRYTGKAEDIIKEICSTDMFTKHGISNNPDDSITEAMPLNINMSTQFDLDMISPNWKPFEFLNRVASSCVSENGKFNDCLFFQQVDGKFTLTNYLNMISSAPIELVKTPWANNSFGESPKTVAKYTIKDYHFDQLFNTQDMAKSGMFGIVSKIIDVSTMKEESFTNYYYINDNKTASNNIYSAIHEDILPSNNIDGNITELLNPYKLANSNKINSSYYKLFDHWFRAMKQSPVGCISVSAQGFDQTSILKGLSGESPVLQTPKFTIANGIPCNINMRALSVIMELNPCTDLKLGQRISVNMQSVDSEKEDIKSIDEFINGDWYIGKIKYTLSLGELNCTIQCYKNLLDLPISQSMPVGPNTNIG